jgi:hypothetical protein
MFVVVAYQPYSSVFSSILLDMMAACAYMNSETLFFECFRECFFHTYCIYDNLRYRFNALWCWICVTVKIILNPPRKTILSVNRCTNGKIWTIKDMKYILILSWKQIQKSKLLIYFCWIWELLTECFYTAFQNNLNSYTNSASQSIESIAKIIINAICMKETFPCLHFILYLATPLPSTCDKHDFIFSRVNRTHIISRNAPLWDFQLCHHMGWTTIHIINW